MRPETINAKISILAVSFLAVALILGLSACGGGSSGGSATVTSITLTPTAGTVSLNTNFDVTANVQLSNTNSTNTAVTWQVNGIGGGNSTIGTIVNSPDDSQVGVYTCLLYTSLGIQHPRYLYWIARPGRPHSVLVSLRLFRRAPHHRERLDRLVYRETR